MTAQKSALLPRKFVVKINSASGLAKALAFLLVVGLYFLFSLWGLKIDVINPDGINWHTRTKAFVNALSKGNYDQTYQVYHPGVTLMWVSGPLLQIFTKDAQWNQEDKDAKSVFLDKDYYAKLSLVIFSGVIFVFSFWLLYKLAGFGYAFFFGLLMSLEPFIIGMRRLYHLDYLMTMPLFLSFLLLIYYNYKSCKIYLPILAGFFFTISFLTKSSAIMFLPAVPFIVILGEINWKVKLLGFIAFLLSSALFLYALFPPLWEDPVKNFPKYYEKIFFGVSEIGMVGKKEVGSSGKRENITLDDTVDEKDNNFYVASLFMRLSPPAGLLVVVGVSVFIYFFLKGGILTILSAIKNKKVSGRFSFSYSSYVTFWAISFAVVVIAALTISTKKSDRYLIQALPFLLTSCAFLFSRLRFPFKLAALGFYLLFVIKEIVPFHPYYFAYSNPYFGGLETRLRVLDEAPFGVATWQAVKIVKDDLIKDGNFGYYTISGSKSVKAISSGGRFSRWPSCVTDYSVVYAFADKPTHFCVQKYKLLDTVKVAGFDYWYIYKRLNQKHESNYD